MLNQERNGKSQWHTLNTVLGEQKDKDHAGVTKQNEKTTENHGKKLQCWMHFENIQIKSDPQRKPKPKKVSQTSYSSMKSK